jgi:glycosyltransferase involved in cell wall biosynthesis
VNGIADAPDISVVVPCHGAARTLPDLLDGLEGQTLDPGRFEVLLVDPFADGGHRVVEERSRSSNGVPLRLVRSPLSGGPAVKRNLGARAARGRLLAFTDADCVPEPNWLSAGLEAFERGFQVVQGRTVVPAGAQRTLLSHGVTVERDVGLHETCNIFYGEEVFRRLGGFPEHWYRRFGVPFGEDADLGWRARRAGAPYVFESRAVVVHPVRPVGLRGHLGEQWLGRAFPTLAREAPELREALFYRRYFLNRRSAAFAAALVGGGLARRFRPAALLALPYAGLLADERAPSEAAVRLCSDAVLFLALAMGSAQARTLVL